MKPDISGTKEQSTSQLPDAPTLNTRSDSVFYPSGWSQTPKMNYPADHTTEGKEDPGAALLRENLAKVIEGIEIKEEELEFNQELESYEKYIARLCGLLKLKKELSSYGEDVTRIFNDYHLTGAGASFDINAILFECHGNNSSLEKFITWTQSYLSTVYYFFYGNSDKPTLPIWLRVCMPKGCSDVFRKLEIEEARLEQEVKNSSLSDNKGEDEKEGGEHLKENLKKIADKKLEIITPIFTTYSEIFAEEVAGLAHEEPNHEANQRLEIFSFFVGKNIQPHSNETEKLVANFKWHQNTLKETKYFDFYKSWVTDYMQGPSYMDIPHDVKDDPRFLISIVKDEIERVRAYNAPLAIRIQQELRDALGKYRSKAEFGLLYSRYILLHMMPVLSEDIQAYDNVINYVTTKTLTIVKGNAVRQEVKITIAQSWDTFSLAAQRECIVIPRVKRNGNGTNIQQAADGKDGQRAQLKEQDKKFLQAREIGDRNSLSHALSAMNSGNQKSLLYALNAVNSRYLNKFTRCSTYEAYCESLSLLQRKHENVNTAFEIKTILTQVLSTEGGSTDAQMNAALHAVNNLITQASQHDVGYGLWRNITKNRMGGSELQRALRRVMPQEPEFVKINYDEAYQSDIGVKNIDWQDHPLYADIQYLSKREEEIHQRELVRAMISVAVYDAELALEKRRDVAAAEAQILKAARALVGYSPQDKQAKRIVLRLEENQKRQAQQVQIKKPEVQNIRPCNGSDEKTPDLPEGKNGNNTGAPAASFTTHVRALSAALTLFPKQVSSDPDVMSPPPSTTITSGDDRSEVTSPRAETPGLGSADGVGNNSGETSPRIVGNLA